MEDFDKSNIKYFNKKYRLLGRNGCKFFQDAKKLGFKTKEVSDKKWENMKKKDPKLKTSPSVIDLDNNLIVSGENKWKKLVAKQNSFGYTQSVPEKLGTGSWNPKYGTDYIPLSNWGGFSANLGRGGNAIPCAESREWLQNSKSPQFGFGKIPSDFKYGLFPNNKFGKSSDLTYSLAEFGKLPLGVSEDLYTARGNTGFDKVPKDIYTKGSTLLNSYSPYTGARVGGILPQPYGPIDMAALKGYPNAPRKENVNSKKLSSRYPNAFGKSKNLTHSFSNFGPWINQKYNINPDKESFLDYGPWVNQKYTSSFGKSKEGLIEPIKDVTYPLVKFGPFNVKPQFKPNYIKTFKPLKQAYPNKDLYLPGWDPYARITPQHNKITKASKMVSKQESLGFGKHKKSLIKPIKGVNYSRAEFGPNNVAYRPPFWMYPGAGGNTGNFLTGNRYLPPYKGKSEPKKVMANNNPRGYLVGAKTLNRFGYSHNEHEDDLKVLEFNFKSQCESKDYEIIDFMSYFPLKRNIDINFYDFYNLILNSHICFKKKGVNPKTDTMYYDYLMPNKFKEIVKHLNKNIPGLKEILKSTIDSENSSRFDTGVEKTSKPSTMSTKLKKLFNKFGKSAPFTTGLFTGGAGPQDTGFQRIAAPLDLYTSMNTPGGYNYPEFSGPRQWVGGYGNKKKTQKKIHKIQKKPIKKVSPGDTLCIKNGKIKVIKPVKET